MRVPLFTLLLWLLIPAEGYAQVSAEPGYTRYTRLEGLSNNYISGLVQDSLGYIWIATHKGLNRFDGRFFTSYYTGSADVPLPGNSINLLNMQGEELLGATVAGGFAYHTATHRYRSLVAPVDSLLSFWANDVYETRRDGHGNYLISTKTGLYVFDTEGRLINRHDFHHAAEVGRKEFLYGGSLYNWKDKMVQQQLTGFSLYDPTTNRIDTAFLSESPVLKRTVINGQGYIRLCFAEHMGELYMYNAERNALDLYPISGDSILHLPLPFDGNAELDDDASSVFFLNDTLLALTCRQSGFYLLRIDHEKRQLRMLGPKRFAGEQCTAVLRDREGRLWVGTNEGLYKENLSSPMYIAYDLGEQLRAAGNCNIRVVYADSGDLYVGLRDRGGILVLDKTSKRVIRQVFLGPREDECNSISQFIRYAADTLWVGTKRGLYWLDKQRFHSGAVATPPNIPLLRNANMMCSLQDGSGHIWMGVSGLNAVECYDRATRTFTEVNAAHQPLFHITYCFTMTADRQGNIWFAGDGICRWNHRLKAIDTLIPCPAVGSVLRNFMSVLDCDSQNNLWLYSNDIGLLRYPASGGRMVLEKEENELTDGKILNISTILNDTIWLCMENGMMGYNIRDHGVRVFPFGEGLPTLPITTQAKGMYYDAGDHSFYIGSRRHLVCFRPGLSDATERPPRLFIEAVTNGKGRLPVTDNTIETGYSDNSLTVGFNAVNFTNPEGNHFAYQVMTSADSSWHLLNWQHSVSFSNLAPGRYHIRLKLFSENNRWPEQYKDIELIVHPPLWKNIWFLVLVWLAVAVLTGLVYRNRMARMRERLSLDKQVAEYEMKALHAQMNPHFIFNALNSIREMILREDNRNASRYLSRFARLIRLNLEHSRQSFVSLQQNIDYLEAYLEMERLRFPNLHFSIDVSGDLDRHAMRLAPMLIQPLVENAIWHGLLPGAGEKWVRIRFYAYEGLAICEIEDNGIGIRQSLSGKTQGQQAHRSMGIENIRRRIAVLNERYHIRCSLEIRDKRDVKGSCQTGTLITLVFQSQSEEHV